MPDFCLLVVGANMGVQRMTKEHISIACALQVLCKFCFFADIRCCATIGPLCLFLVRVPTRVLLDKTQGEKTSHPVFFFGFSEYEYIRNRFWGFQRETVKQ